jgi:hypothetical protein
MLLMSARQPIARPRPEAEGLLQGARQAQTDLFDAGESYQ